MIPFFDGIGIIDIRFWYQFQYTVVSSLVVHKRLWMTNELTTGIDSSTVRKLIFAGIGIGTKKF